MPTIIDAVPGVPNGTKKTRNRTPKATTYGQLVPLVAALHVRDKIELVKGLKKDIQEHIDQQQALADLAKDL